MGYAFLGLVLGAFVNMSLVMLGSSLVPAPEGVDLTTTEGLKAGMALMQPIHFLFPFLAHAFGTFAGAYFVTRVQVKAPFIVSIGIGLAFFAGGLIMVFQVPSPLWFTLLDLILAYIPMAIAGHWLALRAIR
ncbi:MAG: hypothetical protein RLZZ301_1813 [Bacteroidota bacterium]